VEPRIVSPDPKYGKAKLIEPTTLGYLYVAAAFRPGRLPYVLPNGERSNLLKDLKDLARGVEQRDDVVKASVFRAIFMPPTARTSSYVKQRGTSLRVANFDVMVLVQTTTPATAREVQMTPPFTALVDAIRRTTEDVRVIPSRNVRRIGNVDTTRPGLFLFNHFAADDPDVLLQLWEYLAGWYMAETGLKNSVALAPLEGVQSDYALVNWARWDVHPLRHFWQQLSKRSFWRYVPANLDANNAVSMPIYCQLA
jgi:hypothetical protein